MNALRQLQEELGLYQNFHDIHYDSTGIICMSQITQGKWSNTYGRYKAICTKMSELENQQEVFFSQNTFKKFKRSTENLLELKALYIDLDFHKRTEFTREQVLGNIDILVQDRKIPQPTHIIDSGHGLNLIWRIKRTPAQAVPLWRTIQQYLFEQLDYLGADRRAIDVSRVFRPTGTENAKYTETKKVNIISSCPLEYDIHSIQEYVQFAPRPSKKPHTQNQRRTIVHLYNQYSLYYNRYQDILSLCKMRNFDMTNYREITLFLYRYYGCCYLADHETALENALELNEKFTEPLTEREVIRATKSAEKAAIDLKYGYRNQTLIDLLDITDEEMSKQNRKGEYYIKSIISKDEKYRRNNVKRHNQRRNKAGLTQREQEKIDNLALIKELQSAGMSQKEIANELNMTIRTVQRYYKQIKEQSGV